MRGRYTKDTVFPSGFELLRNAAPPAPASPGDDDIDYRYYPLTRAMTGNYNAGNTSLWPGEGAYFVWGCRNNDPAAGGINQRANYHFPVVTFDLGSGDRQCRMEYSSYVKANAATEVHAMYAMEFPETASGDGYLDVASAAGFKVPTHTGGTAQSGSSSTIQLAAGADAANNYRFIEITSGTGAGQCREVASYATGTKTCTMADNWTTAPDNTSVYVAYGEVIPHALGSNSSYARYVFPQDTATISSQTEFYVNSDVIWLPDEKATSTLWAAIYIDYETGDGRTSDLLKSLAQNLRDRCDDTTNKSRTFELEWFCNPLDRSSARLAGISGITASEFTFSASAKTITSAAVQETYPFAAFRTGETFTVTGSASNDGTYTVASATNTVITVNEALVDEAAGAEISIIGDAGSYLLSKVDKLALVMSGTALVDGGGTSPNYTHNFYRQCKTLGGYDPSMKSRLLLKVEMNENTDIKDAIRLHHILKYCCSGLEPWRNSTGPLVSTGFDTGAVNGAVTAGASTIVVDGSISTENDIYETIEITSGADTGSIYKIIDYDGSTGTIKIATTVANNIADNDTVELTYWQQDGDATDRGLADGAVAVSATEITVKDYSASLVVKNRDDEYNSIWVHSGTGSGQYFEITSFDGETLTATVRPPVTTEIPDGSQLILHRSKVSRIFNTMVWGDEAPNAAILLTL